MHLELTAATGELLRNLSGGSGEFVLADIPDDVNLTARVYASNARGRSAPTVMHLENFGPSAASGVCNLLFLIDLKKYINIKLRYL